MNKNIARQIAAYFLSTALLLPGTFCAASVPQQKTVNDIKKILSNPAVAGTNIKTSDVILLSLLAAAVSSAGGFYAGSVWQSAKTNAAKDAVIKQLTDRINFLNEALRIEEREEARIMRVLNEQSDLFAETAKIRKMPLQDLKKAELLGFNQGYDAAFSGSGELKEVYFEKGFREGYGKKAAETFMEGKNPVFSKAGKLSKVEAETLIKSLEEEIAKLSGQLGSLQASSSTDKKILSLITEANTQLILFEGASSKEEAAALKEEVTQTIYGLKKIPVSGTRKELIDNFSHGIYLRLKSSKGILGLSALVLFAAGAAFAVGNKPAPEISHSRLNIQRALNYVYETKPELFAAQVFILTEEYGAELVSSVLYERQQYLPLLEAQLEVISSEGLVKMLSVFKGTRSQEQKKQILVESLSAV